MTRHLAAAIWRLWLRRSRTARVTAALLWATLIWTASSQQGDVGLPPGPLTAVLFNGMHVVLFGGLATLVFAALQRVAPSQQRGHLVAVLLACGWGALDEWHQSSVPGRCASAWDLLTDCASAVLAVGLASWWFHGDVARSAADRRVAALVPWAAAAAALGVAGASDLF